MADLNHEPTLGELMRRLDEISLEVKSIPLRFEDSFIRRDVYRADLERVQDNLSTLTDRIHKVESRSEWVIRTVAGILIATILAASFMIDKA